MWRLVSARASSQFCDSMKFATRFCFASHSQRTASVASMQMAIMAAWSLRWRLANSGRYLQASMADWIRHTCRACTGLARSNAGGAGQVIHASDQGGLFLAQHGNSLLETGESFFVRQNRPLMIQGWVNVFAAAHDALQAQWLNVVHTSAERRKRMRWLDIPGQATRISAMEGLRAYAVALVFVFHASLIVEERSGSGPLLNWAKHGTYGVDLFFLLSGFLIAGLVVKPNFRYGNYLLHRIARIYPAMIGMFVLCIAGMVFLRHQSVTAWQVVGNLLLLNGIPGATLVTPINNVTWSLAYEFAFYLTFPPLYRRFGLWGSAAITALALVPLMLVDASCIRFMMFYAGAMVKLHRLPVMPVLAAASYFVVTSITSRETPIVLFVALFLPVAMLFVSAALESNWLSRIYSFTPLRAIGNVSYSLYLLHPIALLAVTMALDRLQITGAWFAAGLLAGGFALSFCMAAVSFVLLERPYFLLRHRASGCVRAGS